MEGVRGGPAEQGRRRPELNGLNGLTWAGAPMIVSVAAMPAGRKVAT
jgi:hypothetical protein